MTRSWRTGMVLAAVLSFAGGEVTAYGQEQGKSSVSRPEQKRRSSVDHPPIDPRVSISSPVTGQSYAPGSTVDVTVQLTPPLTANVVWVATNVSGVGTLNGTTADGRRYQASFVIPTGFAGPVTLTPTLLDSDNQPILGAGIDIRVVPSTPMLSLSVLQPYTYLTSLPSSASIFVTGRDPEGRQFNLTSSVTGTTYTSSDTNIVRVDPDGHVQAVASGSATVTVESSGLKAFATFVVGNPADPIAPQDVTSSLKIVLSGIKTDDRNVSVQTVELTNTLDVPLAGPLYFVLADLPDGVTLWAPRSGITQRIPPVRSPYLRLRPADALTLRPGEKIFLDLEFLNRNRVAIRYMPKVFSASGIP